MSPIPDHIRAAALADFHASGDTYAVVAARHGISSSRLHRIVNPEPPKKRAPKRWEDDELALTGGRWVSVRGVMRWEPNKAVKVEPQEPIACPCGARLSEPCRTTSGNWTMHTGRLVSRRCRCGNVPPAGVFYCTDECRREARAETYRKREERTPTRLRRAA